MYGGWNWLKSRFAKAQQEPETLPAGPVPPAPDSLLGEFVNPPWRYPIRDNKGKEFWWNWRTGTYVAFNDLPEDLQVLSMNNGRTPL
jgi:hypothetical protein